MDVNEINFWNFQFQRTFTCSFKITLTFRRTFTNYQLTDNFFATYTSGILVPSFGWLLKRFWKILLEKKILSSAPLIPWDEVGGNLLWRCGLVPGTPGAHCVPFLGSRVNQNRAVESVIGLLLGDEYSAAWERETWNGGKGLHGKGKLKGVQEGMCRLKRVQEGMYRLKRVQEGMCELKRVQEGMCRLKRVQEGMCELKRVQEGMCRLKRVQEGMYRLKRVQEGMCELKRVQEGMCRLKRVQEGMFLLIMLWYECIRFNPLWNEFFFSSFFGT